MEEEYMISDVYKLYDQMKKQDKHLSLKRRWLIGLPVSKSEEEKITEARNLQENRTIPEAFIREDDVGYETVKSFVNKAFASCHNERGSQADNFSFQPKPSSLPIDRKSIFSLIDNMTNNGLHLLVKMLTNGTVEPTRCKMKKIIKELLPGVLGQSGNNSRKVSIPEKLYNLLMDPLNFRETHLLNLSTRFPHANVNKVLAGLDDMPFRTLAAMHRKVIGKKGYMPQLQPHRSGWGKTRMVGRLRAICTKMMSKCKDEDDDGGKLKEPLAKAMAVAGLWSNLIEGCPFPVKFWKYSSKIETLQVDIAKAIWLLENKIRFTELKKLQLLLDPNTQLSSKSLRIAVKGMLTEFLFECSDMDTFPQALLETVFVINNTSRTCPYRFIANEEVAKEVESVLCVSSQIKQVSWEFLPEHDFDEDFANAYMEDLEDSESSFDYDKDDNDDDETTSRMRCDGDPMDEMEGVGDSCSANSTLHEEEKDDIKLCEKTNHSLSLEVVPAAISGCEKARNQYLTVQESCDKTSMIAYDFIGCILEKLANMESLDLSLDDVSYLRRSGSSQNNFQAEDQEKVPSKNKDGPDAIFIQTLDKLLPSFSKSKRRMVKEMMGIE